MVDRVDDEKRLKWGFDFRVGRPDPEGHPQYEWLPVLPLGGDSLPGPYRRIGESRAPGSGSAAGKELLGKKLRRSSPLGPLPPLDAPSVTDEAIVEAGGGDGIGVSPSSLKDGHDNDTSKVTDGVSGNARVSEIPENQHPMIPDEATQKNNLQDFAASCATMKTTECCHRELSNADECNSLL